ncbi:MAG: LON peptidase substrate-binding domain-containing protein [Phycisphaerae bacterium]|nr:LON peptidase substrate-binding domain-containing protein [Phycisphaerae bacterium]
MAEIESVSIPEEVPVFPLPGVVLFPHIVLPLHLFEPRYRSMASDALSGPGIISLALLRPGFEPLYHTLNAPIHPVVCVGRIIGSERLAAGTYNILLQGVCRARVVHERQDRPYRVATIDVIPPPSADPPVADARQALQSAVGECVSGEWPQHERWRKLLSAGLPLDALTDVISSDLPVDVELQQALLAEADCATRAGMIVEAVRSIAAIRAARRRRNAIGGSSSMN